MVGAGSAGVFMTMMGVVMGDFWLKNGGHECFFLTDVRDLVPSKPGGWGHWKIRKDIGQYWSDGDLIKVVPEKSGIDWAFFVHYVAGNGRFAETVSMKREFPAFPGSKPHAHYLVGTMACGWEIYAYRSINRLGEKKLILQRFDPGGVHSTERPSLPGNIRYQAISPIDVENKQDDEGSGNEPP